jgi:hypothetical protein
MDDFPSNSHASRQPTPPLTEEQKREDPHKIVLDPVVTGKVVRRKKSALSRFGETLFRGETSVFGHLLHEVLVPTIKELITAMAIQGLEKTLYGEVRSTRSVIGARGTSIVGRPTTNYNGVSTGRGVGISPTGRRPVMQPSAVDIENIIVETKDEAQLVIDQLWTTSQQYGHASVGHLNNLIGQTSVYTDHNYGWTDLTQMTARRVPGGYLIVLPPVENLR